MAKKVKKSKKAIQIPLNRTGLLDMKENLLTALMGGDDNAPSEFVIALSNASAHGKIFEHNGYSLPNDDDAIEVWHNCLDVMQLCAKVIEGEAIGNCTDTQLDAMKVRLKKYKTFFQLIQ